MPRLLLRVWVSWVIADNFQERLSGGRGMGCAELTMYQSQTLEEFVFRPGAPESASTVD